jgi:hypothetical protein
MVSAVVKLNISSQMAQVNTCYPDLHVFGEVTGLEEQIIINGIEAK